MATSTFEGVTVVHDDLGENTADGVGAEFVVGIGSAPRTLAWLTPRRPRRRALDIGTGNGIQALLAAAHCDEVVATDINPRAVDLARANAARNGIANVDVRAGDLFEPVAGERFDLIVANPPFVVSPDNDLRFRDGDADLCARLVGGVADHLADGGLAVVMVNWAQPPGLPWWHVLRRWTAGAEADALLLRCGMDAVADYAGRWSRYAADPEAAAARWLAWFGREGVEQVGAGVVVLRHTASGHPWTRGLDVPRPMTGPAGDHLEDVLDARPLDALEDDVLALAPRAVVADGAVQRVPGLGVRMPVTPGTAALLGRIDGKRAVGPQPVSVDDELRRLVSLGLVVDRSPT